MAYFAKNGGATRARETLSVFWLAQLVQQADLNILHIIRIYRISEQRRGSGTSDKLLRKIVVLLTLAASRGVTDLYPS